MKIALKTTLFFVAIFSMSFFVTAQKKINTTTDYFISAANSASCKLEVVGDNIKVIDIKKAPATYVIRREFAKTSVDRLYKTVKGDEFLYMKKGVSYMVIFSKARLGKGEVNVLSKDKNEATLVIDKKGVYDNALVVAREGLSLLKSKATKD